MSDNALFDMAAGMARAQAKLDGGLGQDAFTLDEIIEYLKGWVFVNKGDPNGCLGQENESLLLAIDNIRDAQYGLKHRR